MNTVYLSDSAFRDIALETAQHPKTETGGILLGEATSDGWFVVEVLDPGPRAHRLAVTFEYNHTYATHLASTVARRYQSPLRLLGLWHRHPGSLDVFSSVDDQTHLEYLRICPGGVALSALVNIDPEFRMTFYRVEQPLRYTRLPPVEIGDRHFPPALLARKDAAEVVRGLRRPGPVVPDQKSVEEPRRSLPSRIFDAALASFLGSRQPTPAPEVPVYRPFHGEESAQPPPRAASAEQVALLDLIDGEFADYLWERRWTFQSEVSPQEPGYRLEVTVLPGTPRPPYPSPVEFVFYHRQGLAMVAIEGREQPYQAGLLRRWYAQFDAPAEPPAAQEPRHEGPPADRPVS
jgi:hypothetical protein